ncbi:MAG: hypothetical protein ACRYFX_27285 [Janthinobacterium lividum]
MKKVVMLLVAVASATASFAKTGENFANTASRQEVSGSKSEALLRASCTVSEEVFDWDGTSQIVTTTITCDCSGAQACNKAVAANKKRIDAMP